MRVSNLLVIICFAPFAYCGINASPRLHKYASSRILKVFQDLRGDLQSFEKFSDVTAAALKKHKIVKVISTNSIIANELTVQRAMDPFYLLLSGVTSAKQLQSAQIGNGTTVASNPQAYVEINLSEAKVERHRSQWEPLGPCLYNPARGLTTYRQGWSVDTSSGVFANVQFAMLLGLLNSANMDYLVALGTSGLLSCDVKPGNYVQFQIITETATITGVKQRRINATNKFRLSGYFTSLLVEDYTDVDAYTVTNLKNTQTACVTDPRYMMCFS